MMNMPGEPIQFLCNGVNSRNEPFRKRVASYAVAASVVGAGMMATTQLVEAEIVYTPADTTIGESLALDVNNDGITDFELQNTLFKTTLDSGTYRACPILDVGRAGHPAAVVRASGYGIAARLAPGVEIGNDRLFANKAILAKAVGGVFGCSFFRKGCRARTLERHGRWLPRFALRHRRPNTLRMGEY